MSLRETGRNQTYDCDGRDAGEGGRGGGHNAEAAAGGREDSGIVLVQRGGNGDVSLLGRLGAARVGDYDGREGESEDAKGARGHQHTGSLRVPSLRSETHLVGVSVT